jgi:hypothetical protein
MRKTNYNVYFNFPDFFEMYNINSQTVNQGTGYIITPIKLKETQNTGQHYAWAIMQLLPTKSLPIYIAFNNLNTGSNGISDLPPVNGWYRFNTSSLGKIFISII